MFESCCDNLLIAHAWCRHDHGPGNRPHHCRYCIVGRVQHRAPIDNFFYYDDSLVTLRESVTSVLFANTEYKLRSLKGDVNGLLHLCL